MAGESKEFGLGRVGILLRCQEPGMLRTTVIGHDVQDVVHVPFSQCPAQVDQGFISAQMRINVEVVDGVVFVADSQFDRLEANLETLNDLANNLRQRGLQRAKMFTWEQTAKKTLMVYNEIFQRQVQ